MGLKKLMLGLSGLVLVASATAAACSSVPAANATVPVTTSDIGQLTPVITPPRATITHRDNVNGTVAGINGNTMTLATTQGQVTVSVTSDTNIEKTVQGSISDLSQGEIIFINGNVDSSGNFTPTSIMIQPGQIGLFNPSGGTAAGGRSGFPRPTNSPDDNSPDGVAGRQFVIGAVSQVSGNSLTVDTEQMQTTVNISSGTVIWKTVNITLSDLKTGDTLTVLGSQGANGNLNASSIEARPPGLRLYTR